LAASLLPARNFKRLAVAIVIAAVVISASILSYSSFEATVTRTDTRTNVSTQVSTATVVLITTVTTTVTPTSPSSDGLAFGMVLNSSRIANGSAVDVLMNLYNTLSEPNNVTVGDDWQLTNQSELSNSTSFGPGACSGSMGPYRVAVFNGFYGSNNYSSATPLSIFPWPPASPYNYCGTYIEEQSWLGSSYYLFQPQSDNAQLHLAGQGSWDTQMSLTVVLKPLGVTLPAGEYTVVGGDEWGDLQIAHFTVALS
jgi:hypothetical protein